MPSGIPTHARNQSSTSSSSCVGPADSIHEPAYTLHALAMKSPSAAGHVPAEAGSILRSERLTIAVSALARTYDHVVIDAGALPHAALERFARLAPRAVLVAPGMADDVTKAARDRLIAAGFDDVTMFVDTPPRPDAGTGPHIAAA